MVSTIASKPSCPKFDSQCFEVFSEEKSLMLPAEVDQRHSLGESEQWLESVDKTHLVLASDKL